MTKPAIWVLCGARAGDTEQALEVARQAGGGVTEKRLAFTWLHHLPNWLPGSGILHVAPDSRGMLAPPWPEMVIATGKRTAAVAIWIKRQSQGKTAAVQLGRPRMAFRHFDLIVTTPQYGLPPAANVVKVSVPFAVPKRQPEDLLGQWRRRWEHLPRPWIAAAVGASKFPLRLGHGQLAEYGRALDGLAARRGGSVLLFSSPRSRKGALDVVGGALHVPHWNDAEQGARSPYQCALALADEFAVTGDSVSMASEMIATGRPFHVLALPQWPSLRWNADRGVMAGLASAGVLSPPRDVAGFFGTVLALGLASDVRAQSRPVAAPVAATGHEEALRLIRDLLSGSGRGSHSSSD